MFLPLWAAVFVSGCSPAYTETFRKAAAKQTLVSLTVAPETNSGSSDPLHTGTAIIVGADESQLYLVTANHVLPQEAMTATFHSILWKRDVTVRVMPKRLADDLAMFTIPRHADASGERLSEPFWKVLPPKGGFGPQADEALFLLGRQHGLKQPDPLLATVGPARLQVSSAQDGTLDRFTMITMTPPTSGDSGGGVFNHRWELIGVHTGQDSVFEAYRLDRALDYVRNSEFSSAAKVKLEEVPQRPSQVVTWVGVGLLATALTLGLVAREHRHAYYEDPSKGDASVKPLNIAADVLGGAGIAILGVQLYLYIHYENAQSLLGKSGSDLF
jgi:hypothetical protein